MPCDAKKALKSERLHSLCRDAKVENEAQTLRASQDASKTKRIRRALRVHEGVEGASTGLARDKAAYHANVFRRVEALGPLTKEQRRYLGK